MDDPQDSLAEEIQKALLAGKKNKNVVIDFAGDLGITKRSPTITNLPNTLAISSHGKPLGGFMPDDSATNSLANAIRSRVAQGEPLSLTDIASRMGSATNDVKTAIISACYAAGYNFKEVKRLFPNLEKLVAPSTDKPISAVYDRYLTRETPPSYANQSKNISPFYSITPTSTNVVVSAPDWLSKKDVEKVKMPLTEEEKTSDRIIQPKSPIYMPQDYVPTARHTSQELNQRFSEIQQWQKEEMAKPNPDYDSIAKEAQRRIAEVVEPYDKSPL